MSKHHPVIGGVEYPFLDTILVLAKENTELTGEELEGVLLDEWMGELTSAQPPLFRRNNRNQLILTQEGLWRFKEFITRRTAPAKTVHTVEMLSEEFSKSLCLEVKKMLELHKYDTLMEALSFTRGTLVNILKNPGGYIGGLAGGEIAGPLVRELLGGKNAGFWSEIIAGGAGIGAGIAIAGALPIPPVLPQDITNTAQTTLDFLFGNSLDTRNKLKALYTKRVGSFSNESYERVVVSLEKLYAKVPCPRGPITGGERRYAIPIIRKLSPVFPRKEPTSSSGGTILLSPDKPTKIMKEDLSSDPSAPTRTDQETYDYIKNQLDPLFKGYNL